VLDFYLSFPETAYAVQSVRIFVDASFGSPQIDTVRLLTGGTATALTLSSWEYDSEGQAVQTSYDADGRVQATATYRRGILLQSEELATIRRNTGCGDGRPAAHAWSGNRCGKE
jgi:YD repeat-containing protein